MHLQNKLTAPTTVHNYLSGVRTWLLALTGSAEVFTHYRVTTLRKASAKLMQHTTKQAEPVTPSQVEHMVNFLDRIGRPARVVKALLLVAYFTLLRQSNLLHKSHSTHATHLLAAQDIVVHHDVLDITVRSSKTNQAGTREHCIQVPSTKNRQTCPVRAWRKYHSTVKLSSNGAPFLLLSSAPLTV